MAIDLPEAIPSIINSFRRSNSAKTIQKLKRKNNRAQEKNLKNSLARRKPCQSDQFRDSLSNCQNKSNDFPETRIKSVYAER